MLHIDANNDGAYEFPDGPDAPVTADGGPLVSPLTLAEPGMGEPSVSVMKGEPRHVTATGLQVVLPSVNLTQPAHDARLIVELDRDVDLVAGPDTGALADLRAYGDDVRTTHASDAARVGDGTERDANHGPLAAA